MRERERERERENSPRAGSKLINRVKVASIGSKIFRECARKRERQRERETFSIDKEESVPLQRNWKNGIHDR